MSTDEEVDGEALRRLLDKHEATMRQTRATARKRTAYIFILALSFSIAIVATPLWIGLVLALVLASWVLWCLWALRLGKCQTCGRRTGLALPGPVPYVPRAWWDPRPISREGLVYQCLEHMGPYMLGRAGFDPTSQEFNS